jgi:hypothetical protein
VEKHVEGNCVSLALRLYGHMNVMWYAGNFDEACWQLLAMLVSIHRDLHKVETGMAL